MLSTVSSRVPFVVFSRLRFTGLKSTHNRFHSSGIRRSDLFSVGSLPKFQNSRNQNRMVSLAQDSTVKQVNMTLANFDPQLFGLILEEQKRQEETIALIASENSIPVFVSEALASCLSNKYSEGYPGDRYYNGNQIIDKIESLCQERALEAFDLVPSQWGVNVQSLSGSPANFQVYNGLLSPNDRILYLELPHGGHLSHGFQTARSKLTAPSKYFNTLAYRVDLNTGLIDYNDLKLLAERFRPHIIIAGFSAYPRHLDYKKFREVADSVGAILMADMAHVAGLVAGKQAPSPFEYCDIVTTTTHKTLRGPRGAMIFYRVGDRPADKKGKVVPYEYEAKIKASVFPSCQGGPHNHTIGALAAALKAVKTEEFQTYQERVVQNSAAMAARLMELGYKLLTDGTENHMLVIDFSKRQPKLIVEDLVKLMELIGISTNKNTIPGDASPKSPNGLRLGSPAMTTRGMREVDFVKIAEFVHATIELYSKICKSENGAFDYQKHQSEIDSLKEDVKSFVTKFPLPHVSLFDVPQ